MAGPVSGAIRAAARPSGDAAARIGRIKSQLGRMAATASGGDIPRPRPVAEARPSAAAQDAIVLMPRQQLSAPQVNALLRKMREGGELTLTELYYLTDAGVLPDSTLKQIDNLETSSIDLPDTTVDPQVDNLTPNASRAKASDPERVYNEINQLSNPQEAANPTQVARTLARLDRVLADPAARADLYRLFGNSEFADARIKGLRQLADEGSIRDAAKIDAAAQSRDAAGTPRVPAANLPTASLMARLSRHIADADLPETLPELADAFNSLPQDTRLAIAARLEQSQPQVAGAISAGDDGLVMSREGVSRLLAPKSDIDGLLLDLEQARLAGDGELEAMALAEIRGRVAAEGQEGIAKDVQAYQQRRDAIAALRREMIASRPDVAADTAAARAASLSPGPAPMRAPGARSVEVSGRPLDEADLPTSYDDAVARLREQLFETQIRPSNPVAASESSELAAAAGVAPRDLPLAFKARPESRSLASRGGVTTREESALNALRAAREQAVAASGQAGSVEARNAVDAAEAQVRRAFPVSRRNRQQAKTAAGIAYRDAIEAGESPERAQAIADATEQSYLDQSRVRSDASLNRPSQLETARGLLDTVVGYTDRPGYNLRRSSPDFTSGERAANAADAQDTLSFSPDDTTPADMMPEGLDANDMEMLGEGGKRGRLGGRQRQSRVTAAMERFMESRFGRGANPLDKTKFPAFDGDPQKVADFVMRTEANTRVEGSPSWKMTRDDLAAAISDHFTPGRRLGIGIEGETAANVNHLSAPMSGGGVTPAAQATVDAGVFPEVGAKPPKSPPGRKPLASDVNLDSSATEITDTSGPASVGGPAKAYTKREIKDAAAAAREEATRQASDEGMSPSAAKKAGAAAAAKVRKEMEAANATASPPPVDAGRAEATPGTSAASAGGDVDGSVSLSSVGDTPATPAAGEGVGSQAAPTPEPARSPSGDVSGPSPGPVDAAEAAKTADDATPATRKAQAQKSSDGKPKKKPETPPSRLPRWLLGAGAIGGLVALSNMGGGGSGVQAAGSPSSPTPPIPPGFDGASLDALSNESAIDRALARIRGSRMGASVPTTQVIQNWTGRN